jgi:hypothetical protein
MPFENPMESYTREQAMEPDIEMGIPPVKKTRCCWGESDKKPVIIPTVKSFNSRISSRYLNNLKVLYKL